MKSNKQTFWFTTLHMKLWLVQNFCVLASTKWMDLLEFNDGTRYLILFGTEKYDSIYNRTRYLTGIKNGITYVVLCKDQIWFIWSLSLE